MTEQELQDRKMIAEMLLSDGRDEIDMCSGPVKLSCARYDLNRLAT